MSITLDGIMDPDGKYLNPLTEKPYSNQYFHHSKRLKDGKMDGWQKFKTWEDRIEVFKKLYKKNILLAKLPPGTGKTVILPKLLLHYFGYKQKIICTTPKQATTSSAAEYSAKCLDVPIFAVDDKGVEIETEEFKVDKTQQQFYETGNRIVGYKHGGSKTYYGRNTLLLFTTDGSLKQTILSSADPTLPEYGGVIIDEAHERTINIDIIIALLLDIIPKRPDFRVIIMSATLDTELFINYFTRIGLGNAYAVYEVKDAPPPFKRDEIPLTVAIKQDDVIKIIEAKINEIISNPALPIGDILAFVTSNSETNTITNNIIKNMLKYPDNNKPYPIAFSAAISKQNEKIATSKDSLKSIPSNPTAPKGYHRKVIIGTNAVESSITFGDPMVYVIESGLSFEITYNADAYCYNTGKFYISQSSAVQRCGRTGRTCAGTCYQLYTKKQYSDLKEFTEPKILIEDFTGELLALICLPIINNVTNAFAFIDKMIQPIKDFKKAVSRAYYNILNMNLIDLPGNIQPLGVVCNNFNKIDITITKMCIGAYYLGCIEPILIISAILMTLKGFDDLFDKPHRDPEAEKLFMKSVRRQIDVKGDHITLLTIYYKWNMLPQTEKAEYVKTNFLKQNTLKSINSAYKDLKTEFIKHIDEIKQLNLFSIITNKQAGGASNKKGNRDKLAMAKAKAKTKAHANTHAKAYENATLIHPDKSNRRNKTQYISYSRKIGGSSTVKNSKYDKYKKLVDMITFKGANPQYLTPPELLSDKILAAVFFGYSNNIACYTGDYNKYYVKYSNKLGGITKSSYDFNNISPPMVIYNNFICTKSPGKMDEYKLNLVSELKIEHITLFLDLYKLKAQHK